MSLAALTSPDNYFEDFEPGQVFRHARGKTVEGLENVLLTNLVMNTAQAHFNEDAARRAGRPGRVVYGGINLSLVLGLAMQDTGEQAVAELGLDAIRLLHPVHHGDTLYAYSEVLTAEAAEQEDAGVVTFRHYGVNQDERLVVQGDRRVLIKRRSHWGDR